MFLFTETVFIIFIISFYCGNGLEELNYRGISVTWRRLVPSKSDEIRLEIIIILALSDKSFSLCDPHHSKAHEIAPDFGIQCTDSWDNCRSWPLTTLLIQCQSKSHEYPKSIIFNEIILSLSSKVDSNNISYKIQFPPSNYSCCWESFDSFSQPVRLISSLDFLEINEINSPPIARFPEHIYVDLHKPFRHSLEVYDPDGDIFQCSLSPSSSRFFRINEKCELTLKILHSKIDETVLIEIEIIEYLNNKKDQIRSRLPYHIIGFIDSSIDAEICGKPPSIKFLNVENSEIHVLLNSRIEIDLIASSECHIGMDECLINSPFHWKIKSHIEKRIENGQNEIEYKFEWIPKTIDQCGFQIHCIRCLDQLANSNDKCTQIFVNGPTCQTLNKVNRQCSWSSFSIWFKYNQTLYKRSRICHETFNDTTLCLFCPGSSIEFQSSLAFVKDSQLFEDSLLSPTRAYSTIKIILILSFIWILIFLISIFISISYFIQTISKRRK